MNKKATLGVMQIIILLFGVVAIGYSVGSNLGIVSGAENLKQEMLQAYGKTDVDNYVKSLGAANLPTPAGKGGLKATAAGDF